MESQLKQKLELLQKELAKKKLKLKKQERRKSAKDHVRQKIKEQTELYSLSEDGSLGADAASDSCIVIGHADSSPYTSVDDLSLAENPRKCCVSFKLTPIHVSMPSNEVDEEVRVNNSNLTVPDLANLNAVEEETCVNSSLPFVGDLVTSDSVNSYPLVTSHSQVVNSVKANPACSDVVCVSASSLNSAQHSNLVRQRNDSAESDSTLDEEGNKVVFPIGPQHSEEMFESEDNIPSKMLLQSTETGDCSLGSENWSRAEFQGSQFNNGMLATDVISGVKCSADHSKKCVEKVDCILKDNDGSKSDDNHSGIYSNLQNKTSADSSADKCNEPTDFAIENGNKKDEFAVSQMTYEPFGNWITNGQEDELRILNIGDFYLNTSKGIQSCNEKEALEEDNISRREVDLDGASIKEDLLVRKVPYKGSGYFLPDFQTQSMKTLCTKPRLETQSDYENSELQKERDSMTKISVQSSVQSQLMMTTDNLAKPDRLLKTLRLSCLGSQQPDSPSDLAYCIVSEQTSNLNSESFSTSDLSFLDEDNDDLYSRVKARRRSMPAKRSSVEQNPINRQPWNSKRRKLWTEVDDELMPQCRMDDAKSFKQFATQRDDKLFKNGLESNSMNESSINSHSSSARQPSVNLESNMARLSTSTECSGNLREAVSNYKHDYLAGSSKQFDIHNESTCAKMSLESKSKRPSTFIRSSENSIGANSSETFSHCETDNHEGSSEDLVNLTDRRHVRNSSKNSSVQRSSFTDHSIAGSSTDLSTSPTRKSVRRSSRLKVKENSVQRGLRSSREAFTGMPDVDAIRHIVEVVHHTVKDKSQVSEEFSLPDVEYHGCKTDEGNSLCLSFLSSQKSVENSIQGPVGNLFEVDAAEICALTFNGVNERDEKVNEIRESRMQVVEEKRCDINAILTNDVISTTRDSSQVFEDTHNKLLNHTLTQHRGLDTSERVKKVSDEQLESACLNADFVQLLDKSSWDINIQEELWLQDSAFEGSTITAGYWSLTDSDKIPVIICCHGNGITIYKKEMEKSEWTVWSTWNADADRSVISAWPLDDGSICSLLVISESLDETFVEILVFDSAKQQRCLAVDRLVAGAGQQIRVCALTERAFCIGTLCNDESNEWEVMVYSVNADCVAVRPQLALEGKISQLICMVAIPEESCVCGFSSFEVLIWHFTTGLLLQKISLNLCVNHCPHVFHENGLLFLPCFLSNNNASGCLIVLNPVSTKTFILLDYKSPLNDLNQACRFTSSGVGDEFLFAVTENGTLLLWSLFSGVLVGRSSGVLVKSATLLEENTLGVMINNRIITIQLSLSKSQ